MSHAPAHPPITYRKLLADQQRIKIPRMQRDYAQGRETTKEIREVRDEFLNALKGALELPPGDPQLPLNLDFVYGGPAQGAEKAFAPLDGQQRLTTLFLLHWYLAWRDNAWETFQELFRTGDHARFSYSVRASSSEFFDQLVAHHPPRTPAETSSLRAWIVDQAWYFRYWRLDPTIQSVLVMLEAIHERFGGSSGLFARLISEEQPAVTFQVLNLDDFSLSDDLYIKMNARGKPLTAFETFKARYEKALRQQVKEGKFGNENRNIGGVGVPLDEFVAHRMDTTWADFFWVQGRTGSPVYDPAIMNLFQVVALLTRKPGGASFQRDVKLLRDAKSPPTYTTYHDHGWLDEEFTSLLVALLEQWSREPGQFKPLLPDVRWFNELTFFRRAIRNPVDLTAAEVIIFLGYALFVQAHQAKIDPQAFQECMRIVHNLAVNSDIDRDDRLQNPAQGLRELLPHSLAIREHIANLPAGARIGGFTEQQLREETIKASLILAHPGWEALILDAEGHGYFRGQIDFLLDFSGVSEEFGRSAPASWDPDRHAAFQQRFQDYFAKAAEMFGPNGVKERSGQYLWQRALLTIGDYTVPLSWPKRSLLIDAGTEASSWKRFLRGEPNVAPASQKRRILGELWDRLKGPSFTDELQTIIATANGLPPWREVLVATPAAIAYCGASVLQFDANGDIYLLSKWQMNGWHAELFTYSLYHRLERTKDALLPLVLQPYEHQNVNDVRPRFSFLFTFEGRSYRLIIDFVDDKFRLWMGNQSLEGSPELAALLASHGFVKGPTHTIRSCAREQIDKALGDLAAAFANSGAAGK